MRTPGKKINQQLISARRWVYFCRKFNTLDYCSQRFVMDMSIPSPPIPPGSGQVFGRYIFFIRWRMPHHRTADPYKNPHVENRANAPPLGYHESYFNFFDAFSQSTDVQFFVFD